VFQKPGIPETPCFTKAVFLKRFGFAKIGPELLEDERVTLTHARIYWNMARTVPKGSNQCRIGQRFIARLRNISVATVNRRIAELVEWGHVEKTDAAPGKRASYVLTSVAFQVIPKEHSERKSAFRGGSPKRSETWKARMWAEANDERAKEIG
jgi:hypothetical protein